MSRSTWTLVVILLLLGLAAYFALQRPGEQSSSGTTGRKLVQFDSAAVDRMEVRTGAGRIVLGKENGGWALLEPLHVPADQKAVLDALSKAGAMEVKSIISSNPEKQQLFQVDSASTLVQLMTGDKSVAAFHVGKLSPAYTETYVRAQGSNDVAVVEGALHFVFARGAQEWRNHTIVAPQEETVHAIGYTYGDTTFAITRSDSTWQIGTDPVKPGVVQALFNTLAQFTADGFIDSSLSPPPKVKALVSFDGTEVRFCEGAAPGSYRVQTSLSPQWYTVQEWKTKGILKRRKDFLP